MSKAPHPNAAPLRLVGADRPEVEAAESAMREQLAAARRGAIRVISTPPARPFVPDKPFLVDGEWDPIGAAYARERSRWAAERREGAQRRRLYLRSWPRAAWAWMWGES